MKAHSAGAHTKLIIIAGRPVRLKKPKCEEIWPRNGVMHARKKPNTAPARPTIFMKFKKSVILALTFF